MLERKPYLITLNEKSNKLELYSDVRLPFDPKGWLLNMRNSLRLEVKNLRSDNDTILHAIYSSEDKEFFDVENILLYNVGCGAFRHLCQKGLLFERSLELPANVDSLINPKYSHHHFYKVVNKEEKSQYWVRNITLARWKNIDYVSFLQGKPHIYWHGMKKGYVEVFEKNEVPEHFGMEIKIKGPIGTKVNLASVVKPFLDGIICAFHYYDEIIDIQIPERLAKRLGEDRLNIERMLADQEKAVLGPRKLLHMFGAGLQWNPADDNCSMVKILFEDNLINNIWSVSGEIFSIKARKE